MANCNMMVEGYLLFWRASKGRAVQQASQSGRGSSQVPVTSHFGARRFGASEAAELGRRLSKYWFS